MAAKTYSYIIYEHGKEIERYYRIDTAPATLQRHYPRYFGFRVEVITLH